MATFRLPPISPLAGSSCSNFLKNLNSGKIDKTYWSKIILTGLLVSIGTPFRLGEKLLYNHKLKNFTLQYPPIFILGHWRSGTTLLHNLLCQGSDIAYVTTYQALFPENLSSKWLFKTFMKWNMPDKRPGDNIRLNADLPQEDEFAISNLIPTAYYRFFYYPSNYKKFYDESVRLNLTSTQIEAWKNAYKRLIKKAVMNTKNSVPVIKNPVNTGRVKFLKETFPSAKFVHIYRNPISVYLSTKNFLSAVMPALWFHKMDQTEINNMIINTYKALYNDYFDQIELVDPEDRIEIKFESFEKSPLTYINQIYDQFGLKNYKQEEPKIKQYLQTIQDHRKNSYSISEDELETIMNEWKFTFEKWGYQMPSNVSVAKELV